jgi:5-deoxy-glucuronate isomerase
MVIRRKDNLSEGYSAITGVPKDDESGLGFGIVNLSRGAEFTDAEAEERAFLLLDGEVLFSWPGGEAKAGRRSLVDETPTTLHVGGGAAVAIVALSSRAELAVFRAPNERSVASSLIEPEGVKTAIISPPKLMGTADRRIRTVIDDASAPNSAMSIGEIVNLPGRWSSFPSHSHPHPELYHFRFFPKNGFGYSEQGEDVFKVHDGDTAIVPPGLTHPQVAIPGHTLVYLWGIRHLEGNRFRDDSRIYSTEYAWLL